LIFKKTKRKKPIRASKDPHEDSKFFIFDIIKYSPENFGILYSIIPN